MDHQYTKCNHNLLVSLSNNNNKLNISSSFYYHKIHKKFNLQLRLKCQIYWQIKLIKRLEEVVL